ncbi:MAG TPA: hypothetical protein V6D33_19960 [Cyanophyceae cyanobacterium]
MDMVLTRQQAKAQKRNAKRLGQLLKDVRMELEQNLTTLEETAIEQSHWEITNISCSKDMHCVMGQLLLLADKWHQFNHFEIDEKLSQLEEKFYAN